MISVWWHIPPREMEKTEGNNNEAQIQMQHQFNDKTSRNILQITRIYIFI